MTDKKKKPKTRNRREMTELARIEDKLSPPLPPEIDGRNLSDKQKRMLRFYLRGTSQKDIAIIEGITQPSVHAELKKIKAILKEQGSNPQGDLVVGESMHVYEEVEKMAWQLFASASKGEGFSLKDANAGLNTVLAARDRQLKLLKDIGAIKTAAKDVNVNISPFLQKLQEYSKEEKEDIAISIIDSQFDDLEDPEPPEDAEIIEYEDEEDDV